MAAPRYRLFVGIATLLAVGVVVLARVSADSVGAEESSEPGLPVVRDRSLPTGALLLNVLLTQGVLILLLGALAVFTGVPGSVLGVDASSFGAMTVLVGVVAGTGLYLFDEGLTVLVKALGMIPDELLRESLTPGTVGGWITLFGGVLPVVAVAEELLFRAALIGVPTAELGVPLWGALAGSSVLFGLAHGVQGGGGIVVTGVLGAALGGVFVVTGSLLAVVVAHYLVNVLEFVVHEWVDWPSSDLATQFESE